MSGARRSTSFRSSPVLEKVLAIGVVRDRSPRLNQLTSYWLSVELVSAAQAAGSASCFEAGVDYIGSDLEKIEGGLIESAEDCQAVCQQSNDCFYFTWVAASKNCYLKGLFAQLGRRQDSTTAGVVSGARFCSDSDLEESSSCFERDVDYEGFDVDKSESGKVPGAWACQLLCQQHADCSFFSWVQESKNCYLKSASAADAKKSDSTTIGMISGPKVCEASDAQPRALCFENNVDYAGYDVAKLECGNVATARACQLICRRRRDCFYFSWVRETKNCYLKSASALNGRRSDSTTTGIVSGPRDCGANSAQIPTSCLEIGVDYTGYDVDKLEKGNVPTARDCQLMCRRREDCFYFSWVSEAKNCYLKSASALNGRKADQSTRGVISGSKDCAGGDAETACYEIGVDYSGFNIDKRADGTVQSAKECQELCKKKIMCLFFSWDAETKDCYLKHAFALNGRKADSTTVSIVSGPKVCIQI
ncbi:pan domain protein [Cystoisospora suis]|uniref:Pan domain protein n=1 Tax=Cystoisospora suis TaxID=483139 RepID=A0A2C6KBF6_9APIC|nr:pan domain protein [Cystoisospora suis]